MRPLPASAPPWAGAGPALAFYGDDFTGSTDAMEVLAMAGLRTVLFLAPPKPDQLARFPDLRAFGIAGGSRALSPEEMERELPPAFEALKASGAPIVHYKTCSTFDSSPTVGSIGKAIEIGRGVFGCRVTPLVVGAPALGRYVVFGNLFARSGLDSEPARLDRHPTMSRHPVTPMDEADLRLHLARQTSLPVELMDVLKLEASDADAKFAALRREGIVLFDTLRDAHLPLIGRLIASQTQAGRSLFCAGSSGVEYALAAYWRESNAAAAQSRRGEDTAPYLAKPVRQSLAISGSCSPVTDRQIARACEAGWAEIPLHASRLADESRSEQAIIEAAKAALPRLKTGVNLILHTSRGPNDPRLAQGSVTACDTRAFQRRLSAALGKLLDRLLAETGLRRAVVCGGDTAMGVARALGIEALEFLAPLAPGSPLCRVYAPGRAADGGEFVFKGGQVGRDAFFLDVLQGGPNSAAKDQPPTTKP